DDAPGSLGLDDRDGAVDRGARLLALDQPLLDDGILRRPGRGVGVIAAVQEQLRQDRLLELRAVGVHAVARGGDVAGRVDDDPGARRVNLDAIGPEALTAG